jgi:hypothetical protein
LYDLWSAAASPAVSGAAQVASVRQMNNVRNMALQSTITRFDATVLRRRAWNAASPGSFADIKALDRARGWVRRVLFSASGSPRVAGFKADHLRHTAQPLN